MLAEELIDFLYKKDDNIKQKNKELADKDKELAYNKTRLMFSPQDLTMWVKQYKRRRRINVACNTKIRVLIK